MRLASPTCPRRRRAHSAGSTPASTSAARFAAEALEGRVHLAASPAAFSAATLAGDVNRDTAGSAIYFLDRVGGVAYFYATDGRHGWELWKSDGTADGTVLVKDLQPGVANLNWAGGSTPTVPWGKAAGDTLYFTGNDGVHGYELWKTDGTAAGTVMVKDINPGPGHSRLESPSADGDALYFMAHDAYRFSHPWRTDGTAAGTVPLFDDPQFSAGPPLAHGGRLFFAGYQGPTSPTGSEPWVSDGTAAGTRLLKDIVPGGVGSYPVQFTAVGGVVFFVTRSATIWSSSELWRTDGTAAGTWRIHIPPAVPDPNAPTGVRRLVAGRTAAGPVLYLHANAAVWTVSPTGTSATKVGTPGYSSEDLVAAGDALYFNGTDGVTYTTSRELWKTDGTAAGTQLVKDILPGATRYGDPTSFVAADDGTAYFAAWETDPPQFPLGVFGKPLWATDGTAAGTVPLAPSLVWAAYAGPRMLPIGGPRVLFSAEDGEHGFELWTSDGTPAGTHLVKDINTDTESSEPSAGVEAGVEAGGRFFFTADDGVHGRELWVSDGTPGGVSLVKDIDPRTGPRLFGGRTESDVGSSRPRDLIAAGGLVYFSADDGAHGRELWRSDGTDAGTFMVKDVVTDNAPPTTTTVHSPTAFGDTVFFVAHANTSADLWKTDGTEAGTVRIRTATLGGEGTFFTAMAALDDAVIFGATSANSSTGYDYLWRTDGTAAGTRRIGPPAAAFISGFTRSGPVLYFFAESGFGPRQLWKTDGTDAGTVRVADVTVPAGELDPLEPTAVGDKIFFVAGSGAGGGTGALWVSDGTAAGTGPVGGAAATFTAPPRHLTAYGGALYFSAADAAGGEELWRSDGTAAGTARVLDLRPGPAGSAPQALVVAGNWLVFLANDGPHGFEPFRTDGTAAGTSLVADLWTSELPATQDYTRSSAMGVFGNRAVYATQDGTHGLEPWLIDPAAPAPAAAVVGRHVFYNGSAFDGGDPAATAADDGAVAPDKAALRPGQAASFANVTSYGRGINGVMVDVAGLPAGATLTAADFVLRPAVPPAAVTVRRGAGQNGSDRVTLVWGGNALRNGWLEVTVKATAGTGLAAPDVFSFGNLVGETGDAPARGAMVVGAYDLVRLRGAFRRPAAPAIAAPSLVNAFDFNRDGAADARDFATLRSAYGRRLPPPLPIAPAAAAPGAALARLPLSRRGVYDLLS